VPENLAKLQRVEKFHRTQVADAPPVLFEVLAEQRRRLENLGAAQGDYVSPFDL
jgi:phosphoenolpyruvate carboxykinase (GTP)